MTLQDRLRATINDIRRKPYPISDLIPLLVQAADALDVLRNQSEVVLPDWVEIRDAGDNWTEGYDNGWNECLAEIKRMNNL